MEGGEGGHLDLEIRGTRSTNFFFDPSGLSWSENKGGPGRPGPSPRSATVL